MALTILIIGGALGWIADPNRWLPTLPFLTSEKPAAIRSIAAPPATVATAAPTPDDRAKGAPSAANVSPGNPAPKEASPAGLAAATGSVAAQMASAPVTASPAPLTMIAVPTLPQPAGTPDTKHSGRIAKGPLWTVQFGVFHDAVNARQTAVRLKRLGVPVVIERRARRFVLASEPLPQAAANTARQKALSLHLPGVYLLRHR
ncbi:MAG TPA: hypothetical protein VL574_00110 [Stellaceae bacterium]|jgi:cell division septation protein DedD|nr:hypothetical protein [Stellaceae bacterium]